MATTHYAVLRVSADASAAQIKAAFRARAKETHPDLAPDGGGADAAEFKAVQRAYEVLRERGSRALYDSSLRVAERAPHGASGMEDFAAAWAWRAANQAESAERRAQREAERRRLDKEAAAWWAYEKAEAERMRAQFRREQARAAGAASERKAALLTKWWHTRRGLQWQDAAVLGVTAAAVLYAAARLQASRRRTAALAETALPAKAPT